MCTPNSYLVVIAKTITVIKQSCLFPEAKDIIVQLESQCTSLHQANRKVKEQMEQLQENMELSRDREMFIHNELSKTIVQVLVFSPHIMIA